MNHTTIITLETLWCLSSLFIVRELRSPEAKTELQKVQPKNQWAIPYVLFLFILASPLVIFLIGPQILGFWREHPTTE